MATTNTSASIDGIVGDPAEGAIAVTDDRYTPSVPAAPSVGWAPARTQATGHSRQIDWPTERHSPSVSMMSGEGRVPDMLGSLKKLRSSGPAGILAWSRTVHLLAVDNQGTVIGANELMRSALGRPWPELGGVPAAELLTEADSGRFAGWLVSDGPNPAAGFQLNFVDADLAPFTLRCGLEAQKTVGLSLANGSRPMSTPWKRSCCF